MITENETKHIQDNIEILQVYLDNKLTLQVSDITQPIFEAFERETNSSVYACNDCKLDAIQWAIIQLKKSKEVKPTKTKNNVKD